MTPSRISTITELVEVGKMIHPDTVKELLAEIERLGRENLNLDQAWHTEIGLKEELQKRCAELEGQIQRLHKLAGTLAITFKPDKDGLVQAYYDGETSAMNLKVAEQLTAQLKEKDDRLNRLTGMKFSDRMHAALKSRAETAEAQLKAREEVVEAAKLLYKAETTGCSHIDEPCPKCNMKDALARLESPQ